MPNILYIVFAEHNDTAIVENQLRLINKPSHITKGHRNYESTLRLNRGPLFVPEWDGKNFANFRAAVDSREFRQDLEQLRDDVALMYANGGVDKVITRGHGSPTSYAGMSPRCLAELLRYVGLDACGKIDLTGCNLGIGPGITQEEVGQRPASSIGRNSFAQRFQLEMYDNAVGAQQRCYTVHARTSQMTVNDQGRKEIKVANGTWKNKALRDKIIFSIDAHRNQTMTYARDFDTNTRKMCPLCRTETGKDAAQCPGCNALILFEL
ncbi:MAG: C80 family cysteine peptidase [Pseudomonadota bacterium]